MTCKNCVHMHVCGYRQTMDIGNEHANHCKDFQDRSRFVEMLCKIGDIGFAIYIRKSKYNTNPKPVIKEGRITDIRFNANMDLLATVHRVATGVIGKMVFATKDKTEQALKERENND